MLGTGSPPPRLRSQGLISEWAYRLEFLGNQLFANEIMDSTKKQPLRLFVYRLSRKYLDITETQPKGRARSK